MSQYASGGVSVRAGASPSMKGRAGLKQARRRAQIRQSRDVTDLEGTEPASALVCVGCGQLDWPDQAISGAPHRRDAVAVRRECSHCGEHGWIDLARESTALALRHAETVDADAAGSGAVRVLGGASAGAVVGAFIGMIAVGALTWPVAVVGALAGTAAGLQTYRMRRQVAPSDHPLPKRWSMALPPDSASGQATVGALESEGDLLRAPLSGRACVAYEVGLRGDGADDPDLRTWALLEQRLGEVRVGEQRLDPGTTHLDLPRDHRGALESIELDAAARTWLRRRGFAASGAALHAFETIVEVGTEVTLRTGPAASVLATTAPTTRTPT